MGGRPALRTRDYPRARGETLFTDRRASEDEGLSPRSRGNRHGHQHGDRRLGTIPALAGKPAVAASGRCPTGDYPRARGETRPVPWLPWHRRGLSPRSRGNRWGGVLFSFLAGTIPALAGKPYALHNCLYLRRDYPRARGETAARSPVGRRDKGLSPRSRGNHCPKFSSSLMAGTIPALAGKPAARASPPLSLGDYPRARGETTRAFATGSSASGLSPRSRGNRCSDCSGPCSAGTIPALAGKPPSVPCGTSFRGDYPRARGETRRPPPFVQSRPGLSPRSRGNLFPSTS